MASSAFWYMRHDVVTSATVPELVGILSDLQEDEAVRSSVAEILGCPGDKKAIDALLQVLKDPSAAVRASAACSLGSAKDVSVVPHLVEAIGDSSAVVRHDAVNAIHDLNSEAGLSGLVIALLDEDESVRYRAAYAIGEMCEMSETPELYEPAVPNLVEAIGKETDGPARYFEVFALSMVGWRSDSALAALVELLEVPRRAVRVAVANELSRIDLARARPQLAEMASAGDSDLKEFVLALLNGTYKEQKD